MWCWRPPQISHHQDRHVLVAPLQSLSIDNESMALMQCPSALSAPTLMGYLYAYNYIAGATHDEEVRCGAGGHPKSAIIRTNTSL